ncbi:ATP-binding protein [Streptomyces sp. NPDC048111]|uniref:ATP-binding protein n=1 Tax=Streptomyces sp. NPDC048111 TaxID=3365500 RepID=UPI0037244654
MDRPPSPWRNTTHDWSSTVDHAHLAAIRRDSAAYAPGGILHLILEVVAYAADEAESRGAGRCLVTLGADGSVSVADDGRGTDTRFDAEGRPVKKPVMATKDLRFFDHPDAQPLPDGRPRRGMSTVAALSTWLVHTNRRADGAWVQRYEHGVPVTDLTPLEGDGNGGDSDRGVGCGGGCGPGTTGTTVHFRVGGQLPLPATVLDADELSRLAASWDHLDVEVRDHRAR